MTPSKDKTTTSLELMLLLILLVFSNFKPDPESSIQKLGET